jgi:glycosyltransferase involved in cell wall biosynthesis
VDKCILVSNTDWYLYNFRLSLAFYLRAAGYHVLFVSPPGEYVTLLQQAGFEWRAWQVGRKSTAPWQELGSLRQLVRLYREIKPDVVHHHTIKPVLYGGLAARWAGVPKVLHSITGRGYVFLGQSFRAKLLQRLVKPLYRLALSGTRVIFENDGDRQYFLQAGLVREPQAYLIESVGVDPARFFPAPEPPGEPVILLAARLLWDKGVGDLVEAARLLRERLPFRVVLAGEPDPGNPASISEKQLRQWEQDGLVEWWGWQADMAAVYGHCHIVVLPSYHEGVPTGLLEAAACARPIVASDIPGCRAVVSDGENGFLVPPGQPAELAAALERLLRDSDLRGKMGRAGREIILRKFTQRQVNEQTLAVYQASPDLTAD